VQAWSKPAKEVCVDCRNDRGKGYQISPSPQHFAAVNTPGVIDILLFMRSRLWR
jgi:hypothetical protein